MSPGVLFQGRSGFPRGTLSGTGTDRINHCHRFRHVANIRLIFDFNRRRDHSVVQSAGNIDSFYYMDDICNDCDIYDDSSQNFFHN